MSPFVPYPGEPSAAQVRAQLATLYRSSELRQLGAHHRAQTSLLGQIGQALLHLLGELFRVGGPHLWIGVGVALLVGLLAAAALILRRPRGALAPPPGAPAPGRAGPAPGPAPEALFQLADRLVREGRLRDAVRAAFQGVVAAGAASAAVHFEPSWTNSELVRAARPSAGLEERLAPLVATFDQVVYGGQPVDPAGCREFTSSCRRAARLLW